MLPALGQPPARALARGCDNAQKCPTEVTLHGMARARSDPAPAGYSGTPLVRKLGIQAESRLGLIGAPEGFDQTLGELPPGVVVRRRLRGEFDVIVGFCVARVELERRLPAWRAALDQAGGLWVAWPKRASGVATDLSDGVVRELGLAAGLVDNKVCAIDETWSGLRFVYRLTDRPGAAARSATRAPGGEATRTRRSQEPGRRST
jgi:hypothetical protein